jgi:homoaconitase/3-isopropylmalate dehydratase large subunit
LFEKLWSAHEVAPETPATPAILYIDLHLAHATVTPALTAHSVHWPSGLPHGVGAKDLILSIIDRVTVSGGTGFVFECRGSTVRSLSMEQRMTVCNMSIEAGARSGMIAPDATTLAYLKRRPNAATGIEWERRAERSATLFTDDDARFDSAVDIDARNLQPMMTYGTNPGMVIPITGSIPVRAGDAIFEESLRYMGFEAGERQADRCGVRRQLHQRTTRGSAGCRGSTARAQGRRTVLVATVVPCMT